MKRPLRDLIGPDGLMIALATCFIGVGAGLWPVRNWDYWWHVVMGRLLAATGQHPDKVYFLYTMDPDAFSYIQAWWAQWAFWQLQSGFADSVIPVLTLRNLMLAAVALISGVVAWRRSGSGLIAATLIIIGASYSTTYVDARAHLMAWPLLFPALAIAYATRARRLPSWAPLVAFPVITALWANLHGSFLVPSFIAIAFGAAALLDRWSDPAGYSPSRVASWAITCALCWAAPLTHPLGARNYEYMMMMVQSDALRHTSTEWFPTTLFFPPALGALFYAILIVLAAQLYRMRKQGIRLDLADLFLLAGFALLAIKQCRELMWFGFVLPIAASPLLTHLVPERLAAPPDKRARFIAAIAAALGLTLFLQPYNPIMRAAMPALAIEKPLRVEEPHAGVFLRATPVEAADAISRLPTFDPHTTRIFCDHNYVGYLLYRLQDPAKPSAMVFTDHRYEMITDAIWQDYYTVSDAKPGWRSILDRYGVSIVVASHEQPALLDALQTDPTWRQIMSAQDHALFTRAHLPTP